MSTPDDRQADHRQVGDWPIGEPPSTEQMLTALRDVRAYPGSPASIEVLQTHLSIVCLAGDFVFKLKKAVALPFADFSQLAERRRICREEVRLNRRLCPDIYLGTAALRRVHGALQFATIGDDHGDHDLDVAVVMLRLPQERMLDELLARDAVQPAQLHALAQQLVNFHEAAQRGPAALAHGDPDKLSGFAADNFHELAGLAGSGLPKKLLAALAHRSKRAFLSLLPEMNARKTRGRVVDGHGDLHARNICMTDPPTIYDCIEFEPAFRCGDVATEVAFLAMDLRYRGAPKLARSFLDSYVEISRDSRIPALLPTLCSYRAMVRAKVAALAASQQELPQADRLAAKQSALRHVLLASAYGIETAHQPTWVLVCGPPASGKSRLCRELHRAVQWPHLSTDIVRKHLAGIAPTERASEEHYSEEFSKATYRKLLQRATQHTQGREAVILLDGNFATEAVRKQAQNAAAACGARIVTVHVHIDRETAIARARTRENEDGRISDAGAQVAADRYATFVAPTIGEGNEALRVAGAQGTEFIMQEVLAKLLALRA